MYKITTLWFILWGSVFYTQNSILNIERTIITNPKLTSINPSFLNALGNINLLKAESFYKFKKGDFVNYFQPNQAYIAGLKSSSYIRLNSKSAVYALASYSYGKGKNSGGSTFLYPYKTPFNFTVKDKSTKGDIRLEKYHLIGGIGYDLTKKITLGFELNYQPISFAKLKDMRNINNILNFITSIGIAFKTTKKSSLGLSYNYNRYIENLDIREFGNLKKNYYALINNGTFMGSYRLYNDEGILKSGGFKKPWVDISNSYSLQYNYNFTKKINWFSQLLYAINKGHFGNENDNSIVYMRHNKNKFLINSNLILKLKKTTQIFNIEFSDKTIKNNEELYRRVRTTAGNNFIQYYGQRELINKNKNNISIKYKLLIGKNYLKAPIMFNIDYLHTNITRKGSYFPYYRKQNISWNNIKIGLEKNCFYKNLNILFGYSSNYKYGNGGNPVDGTYINNIGSLTKPDYFNELLYIEKEYLTSKRLISSGFIRFSKNYNKKNIYLNLKINYTKPLIIKYTKGDFINFGINLGLTF